MDGELTESGRRDRYSARSSGVFGQTDRNA